LEKALNIFVPHCSGMLTDHLPHGDGLVAHGFIRRLAERGHSLFVAAEQVSLESPLPSTVRVFPLRSRPGSGIWGRLDYLRRLRRLYLQLEREIEIDVIHQLNPVYTGITLALWPAQKPVILGPYVADWPTDPDAISGKSALVRAGLRYVKRSISGLQQRSATTLLVTTEEACRRVIAREQLRASSIYRLPHGLDSEYFSPLPVPSKSNHQTVILFLANISERKGIFDLLRAFECVGSRFAGAVLWIAGDGPDERSARAVASNLTCARKIRFLGRQTRAQALELYRSADIYCLPSHGEPFGMTVAEAMSCELPVVVTNAGGVRWIVDDEGGVRVPEKSPQELAQALGELMAAPERRKRMGAHNREKVLEQFAWDRVIHRLEEIYLLTRRNHATAQTAQNAGHCARQGAEEV
jgi:L-malate glycosyltransferase